MTGPTSASVNVLTNIMSVLLVHFHHHHHHYHTTTIITMIISPPHQDCNHRHCHSFGTFSPSSSPLLHHNNHHNDYQSTSSGLQSSSLSFFWYIFTIIITTITPQQSSQWLSVHLVGIAICSETVKANNVSKEDCDALEVLAQVLIGGDDNDYECDVVDDPGHHHHFDLFLLLSPSSTWSSSPPPGGQSHEKPSPSETSPCQAQSPRNKLHLEIG